MNRTIHYVTAIPAPAGEYELVSNMADALRQYQHVLHIVPVPGNGRWLPWALRHMRSVGVQTRMWTANTAYGDGLGVIELGDLPDIVTPATRMHSGWVVAHRYHGRPDNPFAGAPTAYVRHGKHALPLQAGFPAYPGVQYRKLRYHQVTKDPCVGWLSSGTHGQHSEAAMRRARAIIPGKALIAARDLEHSAGDALLAEFRRTGDTDLFEVTPGAGLQMLRRCRALLYHPDDGYTSPYGHTARMAMAMGIPVVTHSRHAELAADIRLYGCGEVCKTDEEMREALRRILADAKEHARMGRNGKLAACRHDNMNTILPWRKALSI